MKKRLELAGYSVTAFDPGETTGIVKVVEGGVQFIDLWQPDHFINAASGNYRPSVTGLDMSPLLIADYWVIEDWRLYEHKAEALANDPMIPSQVIGMIRVLARRLGIPDERIVYQMASQAKGLVDDERLALYGWPLLNRHMKDAARHAIYFLSNKFQDEQKEARRGKGVRA